MSRKIPIVTLLVVSLSVFVYLSPISSQLVYDRSAILGGEWWRLVTGHWVHFSSQHFFYDTAAFGIAGWIIETKGQQNFGWLCLFATIVIGVTMLLCNSQLQVCGGLSGLAIAAVVFLALNGVGEGGAWAWICGAALGICSAKLIAEWVGGQFLVLRAPDGFALVPSNHIAGALTALAVYAGPKLATPKIALATACSHPDP